jgi:hypothetical protein
MYFLASKAKGNRAVFSSFFVITRLFFSNNALANIKINEFIRILRFRLIDFLEAVFLFDGLVPLDPQSYKFAGSGFAKLLGTSIPRPLSNFSVIDCGKKEIFTG